MSSIASWISLRQFPPGRIIAAGTEVIERAEARKQKRIAQHATLAIAAARELVALERRWAMERAARKTRPQGRPEAVALDAQLDNALGGLAAELRGKLRTSPSGSDRARRADRVLRTIFPQGVVDITHLSFEEELAVVRERLETLQGELADDVAALGIAEAVDYLENLADAFAKALRFTADGPLLTFDQLAAARTRAHHAWLATLATILGQFPTDHDDDLAARSDLLEPVRRHDEALARAFKRRSTIVDVDPDTGLELDPDLDSAPLPTTPAATEPT